ncbi:MAG: putative sensor protein [Rubritepida sp.]|nr:putative sensor protein [Rubritepida sp.]
MSVSQDERVDLTNCDREAIHRLGHIQSFGFLIATDGDDTIRQVSRNLQPYTGISAQSALGRPLSALISPDALSAIRARLDGLSELEVVERMFGVQLMEGGPSFDLALHVSDGTLVIEAEPGLSDSAFDVTTDLRFLMGHFDQAVGLAKFCQLAAGRLRTLLGYDRVMVYRFDEDASGEVIAESAAPGIGSFLGQRYPAADIPRQARSLYLRNWLRIIADVDAEPVAILGEGNDASSHGLDLSLSTLRAVSPIHLEYLRNMGVSASLSISIVVQGRLWGLFACHHYSPRLVDFRRRSAAELFGRMFSLLLDSRERSEEADHEAQARVVRDRIMARIASGEDAAAALQEVLPEIAQTIPSNGVGLAIGGDVTLLGETPDEKEFRALLATLRAAAGPAVLAEESIVRRHPAAADWADRATGMLVVPLSQIPRDYLVFFRKEYAHTVTWGGEPVKLQTIGPHGPRLTPRASFEAWKEVVRGRSAPWQPLERRIAEGIQTGLLDVILRLDEAAHEQRRAADARQKLLIAELNHRVRNILALISGLVKQTAAASALDFAAELEGRIEALARAHNQITRDNWGPAPLRTLLVTETETYATGASRVLLDGPEVLITPLAFSTLALVIHELVTNSAKYGALGAARGHVAILWHVEADGRLMLKWSEHGGPPVLAPTRRGFGSSLIEHSIPFDLQGEAEVTYAPAGLEARFLIPAREVSEVPYAALAPSAAAEAPTPHQPQLQPALKRIRTALVVEDNVIIALDTQAMLEKLGITNVDIASSVADALRRIAADPPEFVLLDLNLGRENSFPVAEELDRRGIPFVFATGYGEDDAVLGAFAGRPVVHKPYTRETLARYLAKR